MRAASRRLASPRTPAWSLASHHSMTRASSVASLPRTKAVSSDTHSDAVVMFLTIFPHYGEDVTAAYYDIFLYNSLVFHKPKDSNKNLGAPRDKREAGGDG